MKRIFLFTILVLISLNLKSQGFIRNEPDCSKDNCGKIVGKIVDERTNELVCEEFFVALTDCNIIDLSKIFFNSCIYLYKVAKGGKFSFQVPEGQYCLQFAPVKYDSIYAFDPYPTLNKEFEQKVTIVRGEIQNVLKKIKRSGSLKITLVNKNNTRINPVENFNKDIKIISVLRSDKVMPMIFPFYNPIDKHELSDGELIYYNLPPEKYELYVIFNNMGYGSIELNNIQINREHITETNIIIDQNNNTGIEGKVVDSNNKPLRNFDVRVLRKRKIPYIYPDQANIRTNETGSFRIIGLKEQEYGLSVSGNLNNEFFYKEYGKIKMIKGKILKRIIVVR